MTVIILMILLSAGISSGFGFEQIEKPPIPPPRNRGLSGIWVNELNSTVVIRQAQDGSLYGWYYSIVGKTEQKWWPLRGMNGKTQHTFGFVVNWVDGQSCTAWSGQRYIVDGKETLVTTWILTSTTKLEDDWESTRVGKDTFRRKYINQHERVF